MASSSASSIPFSAVDDRDLDDAELWAVIDSAAAASHSYSRSRKPLSSKHNTLQNFTPSPNLSSRNPRTRSPVEEFSMNPADGEVLQEPWMHRRPQKMGRLSDPSVGDDNRIVVVRHLPRTPQTLPVCSSSESMETSPPYGGLRCSDEKENARHSLSGRFPSVSLFKQYQNAAMAILEKTDYTIISGNPFIKKSGWRKISFFFNLSFEIKDKSIEFDDNRNVLRAEFVVRAYMQGGRFSDGWGSCERREKRFLKPNHDIPSTAETRAKNKACQDLLGIGEYRPGASNAHR
ncbi:hypothetical protein MRB53_011061 [Persea americana]|uniref:Uncharacterized protein n=1 Tax=Persea americana TaxID=3435 RepID=A0ACC2LUS8_PERAE|nr:hypothetical protein MRB53_011061 [Persea americana]